MHISETAGWIFPVLTFMDLSGRVIVQCHVISPFAPYRLPMGQMMGLNGTHL